MITLFVGYDPREAGAYHCFCQSVLDHASVPVSFIPLHRPMLQNFDGQQDGTNAFIFSRYLIPSICKYKGWAIFADGDMLVREDIAKLWALRAPEYAVQVVKHDYKTLASRKYIGTPIENDNVDYPKKNWSSVVLWNNEHRSNRLLTRQMVAEAGGSFLHRFQWLHDEEVGELPHIWNHLVGEYAHSPRAALVHYTLGVPGFEHYRDCEHSAEWHETRKRMNHLVGENYG